MYIPPVSSYLSSLGSAVDLDCPGRSADRQQRRPAPSVLWPAFRDVRHPRVSQALRKQVKLLLVA